MIDENKLAEIVNNPSFPQGRHSVFQMNFLVIGKEPTVQAKLKRCVDELRYREEQLRAIELEKEELKDSVELLGLRLEKLSAKEGKVAEIRTRQLRRRIEFAKSKLAKKEATKRAVEEETLFYMKAYEELAKVEGVKNWEDVDTQCQYWNENIRNEVNLRMLLGLPVDAELVKTALALPSNTPIKNELLQMLTKKALPIAKNSVG